MKTNTKTILFVEDNPLVLMSYQNCLQRDGFKVEAADDGEVALTKLPVLKPDLVILDLMLPKVNGQEVLKFIRKHRELKETPVLVLSNAYMDEQTLTTMSVGANKRLLKTQCTRMALLRAVRELLGMPSPAALQQTDTRGTPGGEKSATLPQETRDGLLKDAPVEIAKIREHCLAYVKSGGADPGVAHLDGLFQRVQFLCVRSGLGECTKISHLAGALEAMLFEIIFKKSKPSPSALQTIAQAVDCLGRLFKNDDLHSADEMFKARVLIVDDDPVCNFVTVKAMKRSKLEAASTQDPIAALEMAKTEHYDMVLLDVNMPALNGFEVCEKLRQLPGYQKTPVIFVTACGEFQSRAQAVLSGGNDLITKPISPLELALKSMIHLIDPREQSPAAKPKAEIKPSPVVTQPAPSALEEIELHAAAMFEALESGDAEAGKTAQPAVAKSQARTGDSAQPTRVARTDTDVVLCNMLPPDRKTPEVNVLTSAFFPDEIPPAHRNSRPLNGANHKVIMKNQTENIQPFDRLATEVARIFFGEDNPSEMTMRLTRIALERYNVPEILSRAPATNGAANGSNGAKPASHEPFGAVVREVTRIIFGDAEVSEMHLRLTRIALERYRVPEIISANPLPETNRRNGSTVSHNADILAMV